MSRNLLRIVDYLPSFYLVGVITMLCTKRHQQRLNYPVLWTTILIR